MTRPGFGDDGTIDELPWASVFDPAANARALSAIQAEGFRAASRIVDRFVRAVGSDVAAEPTAPASVSSNGNGAAHSGSAGVPEFERLTRAWWSMFGQFLLRSMPVGGRAGNNPVAVDVEDPDSTGVMSFEAAVAGSASAEIWLHNRGQEDRGQIRLHCSDLLSHDGEVVTAAAVLLDCAVVPMPARSSRGVVVTVNVPPDTRPGVYRGTLLGSGHPDLWLSVVLTVRLPDT